ncbi:MAG: nucleotidyl transferase AbiEii/AbiGii toxin family protein [Deltaproteobacteria bacterium]
MSAASFTNRLTSFQREVLSAFFERERGYVLTGGAALAGFHLGHRPTDDLDLFTHDADAFERGRFVVADVARALGSTVEVRQDAPGFKRLVLSRADEGLVIDLVKDPAPVTSEPIVVGQIAIDSPSEILANKLTAIVGRAEERDLVDLMFLERAGVSLDAALPVALAKDGGCTPATLAWLLSEVSIPDGAPLPADVGPAELRSYVAGLIDRLMVKAAPL